MAIVKVMLPLVLWESRTLESIQAFEIRYINTFSREVLDIVNLPLKDRRSILN
jgi:hypothetical protein